MRYASIDDVGRCINPLIVHGQTHGAIVQGVGQAICEQVYLDPDSGQPLTGSLMDYGMPHADQVPSFDVGIAEVLSPTNPLGIKAGGEGGTTAAPAAVTQRDPRCACASRRARHSDAGNALCGLDGDPERQRAKYECAKHRRAAIAPSPAPYGRPVFPLERNVLFEERSAARE